jgi:hypothetical protein
MEDTSMPGTLTPAQMYDHELNPVKGWPRIHALDKHAEVGSGVTGIIAGMCLSLDSDGKYQRGCANGAMPLFVFQNQNDFDANSDVGNISGGVLMTLVATGGYELESTEFTGASFVPNAPLTVENTAGDDQGKLKVTTIDHATDMVVGVVSDAGPITNENGKTVVRFWPVYMPQRA